ncbi:protein OXIDATIVE STRESS 3 LIKE 2-like [Lolium rigidum]|uniref:protein OXIDATIVE STRESS 3 LIKE 2-like n=1 Tax=Lolium rigidum TaxID=89674 RepID=UPI001F5D86F9|nr:protein OXIDATIVE STRESS 3 LIKE 2-like [Lolium rigidum]
MATQMDAYLLLGRAAWMAPKIAYEDDDDIGSDSDYEATSRTSAASSSSDLADDASSTSSSSSSADDLFEMSALMTHLPIKRGLSRFFDGKSQSFASLAAVGSLEDLAKPARKRIKPSRSCGGGLHARRDRVLSPRRHCPKAARKAAARAALSVLGGGGSPRRMIIGNALVVS